MEQNNEVYEYDKSLFFSLLDSVRFRHKFKLIQDQQGIIVCPLDLTTQSKSSINHLDLIDRHLFIPSPFLKNHFIPLGNFTYSSNLKPSIYLILDDSKPHNEIFLIKNGEHICKNVKLLNTETGYSDTNKIYRILIINKEFQYKTSNQIYSDTEVSEVDEYDSDSSSDLSLRLFQITSLNDVRTFSQSIDFMQNTVCLIANELDTGLSERRRKISNCFIGQEFLNEIELFKKTYIILYTHLGDCSRNLRRIYDKYVYMFMKSYRLESQSGFGSHSAQTDLIVSVVCEISLIGCLFAKLWPCILKLNSENDMAVMKKCHYLKLKLKLDDNSKESVGLCSEYFGLDETFFMLNLKLILKEIKKISLLNNPFERLESIRTIIDLVTNELTITSIKEKKESNFVITSDILIPLLAYILLKSNINCFKSIIYFIEMFNFSSQEPYNSTFIAELNFFMATFKAAVQLIENS